MVLRAGTAVRMNEDGRATFPTQANKIGELEGYERVGLARVRFEGNVQATVLDASYLEAATAPVPRRTGESANAKRQRIIVENRKIVRAAFDLIRRDPTEKATVDMFARALGGVRGTITDTILDSARQIIADRKR